MAVKKHLEIAKDLKVFLSRLCGGEVTHWANELEDYFLSRLCGGEGGFALSVIKPHFLSRLCGGEAA